jgi:hypothetical protein
MGICMKNVHVAQPKGFIVEEKERKGCHLKKQIESLGFKENEKDNSVYAKFKNEKFIFHILCIDD